MKHLAFILALGLLAAASAQAQDRADIDRTQIIGNRELPKVLYIVPWKKPLPGKLSGRPLHSVLDDALAPLEPDVFRRELAYDSQLREAAAMAAPDPVLPASPSSTTRQPAPNGAQK
jgi:hypothetical protein